MSNNLADVTEAELAVLRLLWERPRSTIRELTDALYPDGGASSYATVQKLLERLEAKGYVKRTRGTPAHSFSAAVDRDTLIGRRLQAVAEALCGGSLVPLLSHLVLQTAPISEADRVQLHSLIEQLDKNSQSTPTKKRGQGK